MSNSALSSFSNNARIAILGAGSWGCTLAHMLARAGKDVSLWSHNIDKAKQLKKTYKLEKPFSVDLPSSIFIDFHLEKILDNRQIILFCCTSQSLRSVSKQVSLYIKDVNKKKNSFNTKSILVSTVKGLELKTYKRMSEVLMEFFGDFPIACLSGPNLAVEVLAGLPTASVIACQDIEIAKYLQVQLTVPTIRLYSNQDIIGAELGGSLKNVMALAAGGTDALALGNNAKSALLTRGLAEMTRISVALGAKQATLAGLAGLGDLMTTCSSTLSRNYMLGFKIAKGASLQEAERELGAVAEGVHTASAACDLSCKLGIEMPIATQVNFALKGEISAQRAIMNLMMRPLASE